MVSEQRVLAKLALGMVTLLGACGDAPAEIDPARAEAAWSQEPSAPPLQAGQLAFRPSVLLITIDTLRRDHLGCYGYFRDTSPNIDALAAEGVTFDRALASTASTLPSHLSILTGLYIHQHGRTSNSAGLREPFVSGPGCMSIARVLGEDGYRTAAVVSSRVMTPSTGMGDGFQMYDSPRLAANPRAARATSSRALAWLAELEGDDPFFLWVHYWETHEPNEPEAPYDTMFETDEQLREWIGRRGIDTEKLTSKFRRDAEVHEHFLDLPKENSSVSRGQRPPGRRKSRRSVEIDVDLIGDLINRYDGDLRYIDHHMGRVLDWLRASEHWERTVVVFTADHGQSLGENVAFGHGRITNVNTFVPLVMRFPARLVEQPARFPALVSLVDIMPTVLGRGEAGVDSAYQAQAEGLDVLSGEFRRFYALTQESERPHKVGRRLALVADRWKYVYRDDEPDLLYDLDGSGEGVDVRDEHGEVARTLRTIVEGLLARKPELRTGELASDEEIEGLLEDLRQLGYVGDE